MSSAPLCSVNRLTQDSCLVLRAHGCSPPRQSLIRSSAGHFSAWTSDPRSRSQRHPPEYTVYSRPFEETVGTSDCSGVRSVRSCRWRVYAHSDTQRRAPRQRVTAGSLGRKMMLIRWKLEGGRVEQSRHFVQQACHYIYNPGLFS